MDMAYEYRQLGSWWSLIFYLKDLFQEGMNEENVFYTFFTYLLHDPCVVCLTIDVGDCNTFI